MNAVRREVQDLRRDRILLLTSCGLFVLFVPLAWWIHKHRPPPIDVAITHTLQKEQSSFMRSFVKVLNNCLCSEAFLNVLAVPLAMLLWKMRLRLEAVMTLAMCWTSMLARRGIKPLVDRPRPSVRLVLVKNQSRGKSFPSGDVASSVSLWGWMFALGLLQKQEMQTRKKFLLSLPLLLVALVGPARIYLGDHWATDVLGGYLFGGGWLGLSLRLYLMLREKGVLNSEQRLEERSISWSHW